MLFNTDSLVERIENIINSALFIREFEQNLLKLFNKGLLNGTVHTCVGQELTPVVLCQYLTECDRIFSNHRGHGHYLAFGGDSQKLLAELMGKKNGISGGIGGSQHIYNERFISNGIQGGMTPIAVGYSFVNKLKGSDGISVVFIGDGTLGEGVLYEAMNLASVCNAPTLFVLENNGFAQSTSIKETFSGNVENRVNGFGIQYFSTNIWNIDDLDRTFDEATKYVRSGKPAFVEVECYRLNSHSKGDDNRDGNEVADYWSKDVLNKFSLDNPKVWESMLSDISSSIDMQVSECLEMMPLNEVKVHSFINNLRVDKVDLINDEDSNGQRYNRLIYRGINELLSKKESIFIGEDIKYKSEYAPKPYGGAFKVSDDLSELYPERVFNTPISEQAIIGFGIGASLNGYRSIVEIMFGDFMTLGVDMILQHASKIPEMYGCEISMPLVIRTPMGARRGYGPTHSQNIERIFLFWPNINVIALNSFLNPRDVYRSIETIKNTVIVIEDKILYTRYLMQDAHRYFRYTKTDEDFPTIEIEPRKLKPNIIIVVYGGMLDELHPVLHQLLGNDIIPHVVCFSSLSPCNVYPVIEALKITKNILFVEEGTKHGGFSSEIVTYLVEKNYEFNLVCRISNESIIPCSRDAERVAVPNSDILLNKIMMELIK